MKAGFILPLLIAGALAARAQQFQTKLKIKLSPDSHPSQIIWADINNDSLLDIIVVDTSKNRSSVWSYSGLTKGAPKRDSLFSSAYRNGQLIATEFNADSKIDLVISGASSNGSGGTQAFINQGNFMFAAPSAIGSTPASHLNFTDINNDGQKDMVLLKDSSSLMLLKNSQQTFHSLWDSTSLTVSDLSVFDFDGNGFNDIAISGKNKLHKPVLTIVEFGSSFDTLRTIHVSVLNNGTLATGDLDHDGYFDLIISGRDASGQWSTDSWMNHDSIFVSGKTFPGVKASRAEIADFTSDGKADVSLFGKDASGNQVHSIVAFDGTTLSIPSDGVIQQMFGDYDRDGDLDLLQMNDTLGLILLENKVAALNMGPVTPHDLVSAVIYSRLFLYWGRSPDDHTASPAITYDLSVSAGSTIYDNAEFDPLKQTRLTVTNGDQSTHNFALLQAPARASSINVQAIDNAYFTSSSASLSGGGPGGGCGIAYQPVSVCDTLPVTLKSAATASWFSFSKGFLKKSSSLKIKHAGTDTVFSFTPVAGACPIITVYTIMTSKQDTVRETFYFETCKGGTVPLTIGPQWSNVTWTFDKQKIGTGANKFDFSPTMAGIVIGNASNANHCFLLQQDHISIYQPVLTLAATRYQISNGASVQLHASGGKSYQWVPPDGLDQTTIPDPTASPDHTVLYTVTLTDSAGCTASGTVEVDVVQAAYIPSLFTPNGDGRNEELKIYGLGPVPGFSFRVVNREGATVYETTDTGVAGAEGWNGTHNGAPQPSGIYYWKVEGDAGNGEAIRLNGKKQGSVMLVR